MKIDDAPGQKVVLNMYIITMKSVGTEMHIRYLVLSSTVTNDLLTRLCRN